MHTTKKVKNNIIQRQRLTFGIDNKATLQAINTDWRIGMMRNGA